MGWRGIRLTRQRHVAAIASRRAAASAVSAFFSAMGVQRARARCCQADVPALFAGVVRHDEGVCYLNTNDVQQGQAIPPIWPR
jgi:hypothetical protein